MQCEANTAMPELSQTVSHDQQRMSRLQCLLNVILCLAKADFSGICCVSAALYKSCTTVKA